MPDAWRVASYTLAANSLKLAVPLMLWCLGCLGTAIGQVAPVASPAPRYGDADAGALPAMLTAEVNAPLQDPYAAIAEAFEKASAQVGGSCVPVNVLSESSLIDSVALVRVLTEALTELKTALEGAPVRGLYCTAFAAVSPRTRTWGADNRPNFTEVREAARALAEALPEVPLSGALTEGVNMYVAAGELARTLAWVVVTDRPTLIVGEQIVAEAHVSYIVHALGIAGGLRPLWGLGPGGCASSDNVADTPHASGRNYDCAATHVSGCTGEDELDANYMDARYCGDLPYSFTPGQLDVLAASALSVGVDDRECAQVADLPDATASSLAGCGLLPTPNPCQTGACVLEVPDRWLGRGVRVELWRAGTRVDAWTAAAQVDISPASHPGMYTARIHDARSGEACAQQIVIAR